MSCLARSYDVTVAFRPRLAVRGAGIVVAVLVLVVVLAVGSVPPATAQVAEVYTPPVDAAVIDPFRPPDQPWLSGNRGLEYDTGAGAIVYAIGSGLVVFAGPVAGQLYVTILHGDGIRSSYSYLSSISVTEGDRVWGKQGIGSTGEVPFHLGARVGDVYIDPAALFGSRVGAASVFLVPLGGGPPSRGSGANGGGGVLPPAARHGEVTGSLVVAAGRDLVQGISAVLG